MGLLDRQHPGVHGPVLVVLAFPSKGTRSGPRLDNQVVALLEPLPVVHWVGIIGPAFDADAPYESGDDAAAGDYVQHGDLLGQADRIFGGGQHVAQH